MNRINLREFNMQQEMLKKQIENNKNLANVFVETNSVYKQIQEDLRKFSDDYSFVFHSHTMSFSLYKRKEMRDDIVEIDHHGNITYYEHIKELDEMIESIHAAILREFY